MIPEWIPRGKEAYLFDINGVVVHEEKPFSVIYCERVGLPTDTTREFFGGVFQKCLVGEADLKEEIAPYLPKWKWTKGVDEYIDMWFAAESRINEEMRSTVERLHKQGEQCYFVTNQEKYRTEYLAKRLGLENIVSDIFSSSSLGAKKPEPEFYDKVLSSIEFDGSPEAIFFLDDDKRNVEAAKELGFDTFHYTISA